MTAANVAYLISGNGNITVHMNGKTHIVNHSHLNYSKIKDVLKQQKFGKLESLFAEKLDTLLDVNKAVKLYSGSKFSVKHGNVIDNEGRPIHNAVCNKIVEFVSEGFNAKPLALFLDNLQKNPNPKSIASLYNFLERHDLPITNDGFFLAYKSIKKDWKDHHTGRYNNKPGRTIGMNRNLIDDNENVCSSQGFHCGSLNYVKEFIPGESRHIVVKVNPKDVVVVPNDCQYQKVRVCRYKVVSEYNPDKGKLSQRKVLAKHKNPNKTKKAKAKRRHK